MLCNLTHQKDCRPILSECRRYIGLQTNCVLPNHLGKIRWKCLVRRWYDKKNHVTGGTFGLSGWKQTNGALQKSSQTHCLSDAYWDTTGFPLTSSPTVTAPFPFSWNCFLPSSLCGTNHCWLPKFKSALPFCLYLSICYRTIQLWSTQLCNTLPPLGQLQNLEGIVMSHDQIAELAVRKSDCEVSPITFG